MGYDCLLVPLELSQKIRVSKPSLGGLWICGDATFIGSKRIIVALELPQNMTLTKPWLDEIGLQRECLLVSRECIRVALEFEEDIAFAKPRLGEIRSTRYCIADRIECLLKTAKARQNIAAQNMGSCKIRPRTAIARSKLETASSRRPSARSTKPRLHQSSTASGL